MLTYPIHVTSAQETRLLGEQLAQLLPHGHIFGLSGPLGAGKTEFVKGIAAGLGVQDEVVSPTFVLEAVYDLPAGNGKLRTLHHWDLYRLNLTVGEGRGAIAPENDIALEISEFLNDTARICIIEWPERVPGVLDLLSVNVNFDFEDALVGIRAEPGTKVTAVFPDSGKRKITFCILGSKE